MPLSRSELLTKIRNQSPADRLCDEIDAELVASYLVGGRILVPLVGVSPVTARRVQDIYTELGWNVYYKTLEGVHYMVLE